MLGLHTPKQTARFPPLGGFGIHLDHRHRIVVHRAPLADLAPGVPHRRDLPRQVQPVADAVVQGGLG